MGLHRAGGVDDIIHDNEKSAIINSCECHASRAGLLPLQVTVNSSFLCMMLAWKTLSSSHMVLQRRGRQL